MTEAEIEQFEKVEVQLEGRLKFSIFNLRL